MVFFNSLAHRGLQCWPYGSLKRAVLHHETGRFGLQNGPFCTAASPFRRSGIAFVTIYYRKTSCSVSRRRPYDPFGFIVEKHIFTYILWQEENNVYLCIKRRQLPNQWQTSRYAIVKYYENEEDFVAWLRRTGP
ncbi:hypothetical protein [Marseilla massiliensis]|uniref:hypothetical protein n=1 Tax=Marseilla massiliensis TaxID=1841864 RepID=UPI00195FA86D|nr:hypothetical protein [Marseilla massiliensis]